MSAIAIPPRFTKGVAVGLGIPLAFGAAAALLTGAFTGWALLPMIAAGLQLCSIVGFVVTAVGFFCLAWARGPEPGCLGMITGGMLALLGGTLGSGFVPATKAVALAKPLAAALA